MSWYIHLVILPCSCLGIIILIFSGCVCGDTSLQGLPPIPVVEGGYYEQYPSVSGGGYDYEAGYPLVGEQDRLVTRVQDKVRD